MPTQRLAVWWLIASEIVIFGGVLASYAANTNPWIGAFNTFVLLSSSLSAVLAHQAAERGDGKRAANLLYATIAGGGVFRTLAPTPHTTTNIEILKYFLEIDAKVSQMDGQAWEIEVG